jgi:hypothetical protein
MVHLGTLVAGLFAGRALGWAAIATLAGATIVSNVVDLALMAVVAAGKPEPAMAAEAAGGRPVSYGDILAFFWPVAVTSAMFAMSRPVMYSFINRTATAVTTVAALRLAFDAAMFFQNPVNQFRHLYTTYGGEDPQGVRRFMLRVTAGLTAGMVLLAFTPLATVLFRDILGVDGEVLTQAVVALRVLCLVPLTIAVRNIYHGQLMVRRRTTGMAIAATLRVVAIGVISWALFRAGWLNYLTCAMLLVVGFVSEAAAARHSLVRLRRHGKGAGRGAGARAAKKERV